MAKHRQQEMLSPSRNEGWDKPTADYVGADQHTAYVLPFLFVGSRHQYREFCRSTGFTEIEVLYLSKIGDLFGRRNTICFSMSMKELVGYDFKASAAFEQYVDAHNIRRIRL